MGIRDMVDYVSVSLAVACTDYLPAGVFGLIFGALCAIPYFFIGGWSTAVSWWVAGIPHDIIHCVSNVVITLVLFPPLRKALSKLKIDIR